MAVTKPKAKQGGFSEGFLSKRIRHLAVHDRKWTTTGDYCCSGHERAAIVFVLRVLAQNLDHNPRDPLDFLDAHSPRNFHCFN